ncbi:MAG: polyribonucleotide nucleotidyltransferase [Saprospiraceae bacterium]|nr:polyribonucleotide nucleotidyltransferase [Saprospiraceae bacterium]
MGNIIPTSVNFKLPNGKQVTIETGKLATLAHGSAMVKIENTMILATVVAAQKPKEGQDFFPLSVDYQEKFAGNGKIPGNFFRRESKLSDYEVLISRLVDRAIRPLFDDEFVNEVQIMLSLISGDSQNMPDCYAALAASAALAVSDIPFNGPISEVRVAKIKGEFVVNPNRQDLPNAELDIIIAATMENVMMVEGQGTECQEHDLITAIKIGHDAIKVHCQAQLDLAAMVGEKATVKRTVTPLPVNEELKDKVAKGCTDKIYAVARSASDKMTRKKAFDKVIEEFNTALQAEMGENYESSMAGEATKYFDKLKKKIVRSVILNEGLRLDGRKYDEVRPIWCEVDYLPSAHGSAIFNRGETQSLTSLTLGSKTDTLLIDNSLENYYEKFILHYNFPAFSVGEIKPNRGPGRREVGHANLAARSLRQVLPSDNPYTLRIVSDILESNGSSSMATVCAGSLALMDAGIKIKAPVSGIAMGMIAEDGNVAILSDILGDEDALGDMDFKVTGTEKGITGCQMDIKIDGLPYEMLEKALLQAKAGRIHILNEMKKAISEVRADLKPHAPRMVEISIDKSFIGAVIGPGGKIIQDIQARTGTIITIEEVDERGIVSVMSSNGDGLKRALEEIDKITFTPTVGDTYDAIVESIMEYGAFVKFKGKSGLVHISEIAPNKVDKITDVMSVGDTISVKYIGTDPKTGKMRLSRKATMLNPRDNKPKEA